MFAGLLDDTSFVQSGIQYEINYNGGTNNNDVQLTVLPAVEVYVDDSWRFSTGDPVHSPRLRSPISGPREALIAVPA